jgi:beta-1,2-mannobiose phosphorylase / 1,2-beta-oligomannan phosphorylase
MMTTTAAGPFHVERLGVIMRPEPENPSETWGVFNPGGARGPNREYCLFPRLVAQGNFSRIGRAHVTFAPNGTPMGVERLGLALEPCEPYEVTREGGGVEDPRITYIQPLEQYVMTYTASVPGHPRIALAVSRDLVEWTRLGPLRYALGPAGADLNRCGNKDGVIFPEVVPDPHGRPSIAIVHRPTLAIERHCDGCEIILPPCGVETLENIWISYVPLDQARADIHQLTQVADHRPLMAPLADWEQFKIGAGAPPVRLPDGWLLLYHAVSPLPEAGAEQVRYCVGAVVLDLKDPTTILYRTAQPILQPETSYEVQGIVPNVVFPTATELRSDGRLDVYYGAADFAIGVARLTVSSELLLAV